MPSPLAPLAAPSVPVQSPIPNPVSPPVIPPPVESPMAPLGATNSAVVIVGPFDPGPIDPESFCPLAPESVTIQGKCCGGGSPAPPLGSVQWNNNDAFGGSDVFIFDSADTTLTLGDSSPGSGDGITPYTLDVVGARNSYVARFTNPGSFCGVVIDHADATDGDSILSFRSAGKETAIIQYDDDEDNLTFWTGGRDAAVSTLTCSTDSFVGILNTSPAFPLDIAGDANIADPNHSGIAYRMNGIRFAQQTTNYGTVDLSNIGIVNSVGGSNIAFGAFDAQMYIAASAINCTNLSNSQNCAIGLGTDAAIWTLQADASTGGFPGAFAIISTVSGVATFRFMLNSNGVVFPNLPTSAPSGSGQVWNNGGVLNITP